MRAMRDTRVEAAGVRLHVRRTGDARSGPAVLVLHGFTGSVESMQGVVEALSARHPVVAIDLVGHGESESPADPARYSMPACVEQLVSALDALGLQRVHALGYSMGGRVALSLAVAHPDRVASLLLVGASPGLADARARAERVAADEALAARIEREGLEPFVDHWMSLPLFASQAALGETFLARARAQRLRGDPAGLARSLRGMGTGSMPSLQDRLAGIRCPVCLVAGSRDEKFAALAGWMQARLPRAQRVLVPGAGHAAHLEDPDAFARVALRFLAGLPAPGPRESGAVRESPSNPRQEIRS